MMTSTSSLKLCRATAMRGGYEPELVALIVATGTSDEWRAAHNLADAAHEAYRRQAWPWDDAALAVEMAAIRAVYPKGTEQAQEAIDWCAEADRREKFMRKIAAA